MGSCYYWSSQSICSFQDGSSVVTGDFIGSATFGEGEANETELVSEDYLDVFIARYNPDGTLAWARRAGGAGGDSGVSISALSNGHVILTGVFENSATFGPGETGEIEITSFGEDDIFLAGFNPDGTLAWARSAGGVGKDSAPGLSSLPDGSFILAGGFKGNATFGPSESNETTIESVGEHDAFVARYNLDGTLFWAKRVGGGIDSDGIQGISAFNDGSSLSAGMFRGESKFVLGESEKVLNSEGKADIFILRLGP